MSLLGEAFNVEPVERPRDGYQIDRRALKRHPLGRGGNVTDGCVAPRARELPQASVGRNNLPKMRDQAERGLPGAGPGTANRS